MRFHHLGLATRNVGQAAELLGSLMEAPVCHAERFEGMEVRFLELPEGYLELLEPTESGPVERFLDRHGPGIHHVAFETADIDVAMEHARSVGMELIDTEPRAGAWGHEAVFIHPDSTGGVLIEFVTPRKD